ncbi:MAG: hypothetical protein HY906_20960 [Deltaproteobacteria bacterium]|nr:hypothetical protein [Deltaproteobacteria bacterium]
MTTSAPPTEKPGPYNPKRSVKNYLIDSRLQLKYAGLLVLVTALISAALFAFLWKTSRNVVKESQTALAQSRNAAEQNKRALDEALKVSDLKRKWYVNNPRFMNNPKLLELVTEPSRETDQQIKTQLAAVAKQQDALAPQHAAVVRQQGAMRWSIIGALLVLVVAIGLLGIYVTHKVAGPIHKMKGLLKQVGDGKLVFEAHLRKGDELQDFFEAFSSMADSLRTRQEQAVTGLERAIEAARAGGASSESLAQLTTVRDEMKRALAA